MNLIIGPKVREKLANKIPPITEQDILECFENRIDSIIEERRAEHKTKPPTLWFIAETNHYRRLKIVFIQRSNWVIIIKTAYEPDELEEAIYEQATKEP